MSADLYVEIGTSKSLDLPEIATVLVISDRHY